MQIHWLDLIVLGLYFISMALLGYYFSRKNKNTNEYFTGGGSFGSWIIGISLVGYSISSVTFMAYPADSFKTGWVRFLPNLMLPVALVLAAWFFIPFFRRLQVPSAYHFLEKRFGPSIRFYVAFTFILGQLARLSIVLYLVAVVIHEMTGLEPVICILVAGCVTAFYTVVGGIDAVIWTDVIQAVVLFGGGLLCLAMILYKLPGGLGQVLDVAWADGKLAFADIYQGKLKTIPWGFALREKTVMMMLLLGLIGWVTEYSGNQNTVQRYVAAKSTAEARKGIMICGFSCLPIWALFMFIGTALYVFFKINPTPETTEMLTGARQAEQVLPFFIVNYMPPGVVGLIIAGVLAAAMSSLSASINAVATVSIIDFYQRLIAKNRSDRHYLKAAWVITSLISIFMIGGALVLVKVPSKTLLDTSSIITSLLAGGTLGIYLLGIFCRHGDARAVWLGIVMTMIFTTWTLLAERSMLPEWLTVPFDLYYTSIFGNLIMFVVAFGTGILIFKKSQPLPPSNTSAPTDGLERAPVQL